MSSNNKSNSNIQKSNTNTRTSSHSTNRTSSTRARSRSAVRNIEPALSNIVRPADPHHYESNSDHEQQQHIDETPVSITGTHVALQTSVTVPSSLSTLTSPNRPAHRSPSPTHDPESDSSDPVIEQREHRRTTSHERRKQRRREERDKKLIKQFMIAMKATQSRSRSSSSSSASSREPSATRSRPRQQSNSNTQRTSNTVNHSSTGQRINTGVTSATVPQSSSSFPTSNSLSQHTQHQVQQPIHQQNSVLTEHKDNYTAVHVSGVTGDQDSNGTPEEIFTLNGAPSTRAPTTVFSNNSIFQLKNNVTAYTDSEKQLLNAKKKLDYSKVDFRIVFPACPVKLTDRREFNAFKESFLLYLGTVGAEFLIEQPTQLSWKKLSLQYVQSSSPINVYTEFRNVCSKLYGIILQSVKSQFTNMSSLGVELLNKFTNSHPNFTDEIDNTTAEHVTDYNGHYGFKNPFLLFKLLESRFNADTESVSYAANKVIKLIADNISNYKSTQAWLDQFNFNVLEVEKIMVKQAPDPGRMLNNLIIVSTALSHLKDSKWFAIKRKILDLPLERLNMQEMSDIMFQDEHDRYAANTNKLNNNNKSNAGRGQQQAAHSAVAQEIEIDEDTTGGGTLSLFAGNDDSAGNQNVEGGKKKNRNRRNKQNKSSSGTGFIASKSGNITGNARTNFVFDYISAGDDGSEPDSENPGGCSSSDDDASVNDLAAAAHGHSEIPESKSTIKVCSGAERFNPAYLFVLDTGSTVHITGREEFIEPDTMRKISNPITIEGFNGTTIKTRELGEVQMNPLLRITNMIYSPTSKTNLISASSLVRSGLRFRCHMSKSDRNLHCITFFEMKNDRNEDRITFYLSPQGLWVYKPSHKVDTFNQRAISTKLKSAIKEPKQLTIKEQVANKSKNSAATKVNTTTTATSTPTTVSSSTTTPTVTRIPIPKTKEAIAARNKALKQSAPATYARAYSTTVINNGTPTTSDDDAADKLVNNPIDPTTSGSFSGADTSEPCTDGTKISSATGTKMSAAQLHELYGHINLSRGALDALGCTDPVHNARHCATCAMVRLRKKATGAGTYTNIYTGPCERMDWDIQGPMTDIDAVTGRNVRVRSIGGSIYLLNGTCHVSGWTVSYAIKRKNEAEAKIKETIAMIKRQFNIDVKCCHSDQGGEFIADSLKQFYAATGIVQSLSPAYSPSTNGTIERLNQTILLTVKSMLYASSAPTFLWAEAAIVAADIYNNTPLKKLGYQSPLQVITGNAPIIPECVFGSDCIIKTEPHVNGKLTIAGVKGMVISKNVNKIGFRVYAGTKIVSTINVKINNGSFTYAAALASGDTAAQYHDDYVLDENIEDFNISNQFDFADEVNAVNDCDDDIIVIPDATTYSYPYSATNPHVAPSSSTAHQQPSIKPNDTVTENQINSDDQFNDGAYSDVDCDIDINDEHYTGGDECSDASADEYQSQSDSEHGYDDQISGDENQEVNAGNEIYTGTYDTGTYGNAPILSPIDEEPYTSANRFAALSSDEDSNENFSSVNPYENDISTVIPIGPLPPLGFDLPNVTVTSSGRISRQPTNYPILFADAEPFYSGTPHNIDVTTNHFISATTKHTATGRHSAVEYSYTASPNIEQHSEHNSSKVNSAFSKTLDHNHSLPIIGGNESDDEDFGLDAVVSESSEPQTYKQAMKTREHKKWSESMRDEFKSIVRNQVLLKWKRASNIRLLGTRWVYKIKRDEFNRPVRYKSRLVAKGYDQIPNQDFHETFSPVAHFDTLRLLLSLSTIHDTEIKQCDFKTAFLNAGLDEDVFIAVPPGCECIDDDELDPRTDCYKLNRSLYGLRQSSRNWNILLTKELVELGYKPTASDPCLFYKYVDDFPIPILIGVYVDDIIISVRNEVMNHWLADKAAILSKYDLDDLDDIDYCLKMKIIRDRIAGTMTISQTGFVISLLDKMKIDFEKFRTTNNPSMSANLTDPDLGDDTPLDEAGVTRYQQLIGSLMYLSNTTRIDICFTVHLLARYSYAPTSKHWKSALHCLRYVAGTADHCLEYTRDGIFTAGNGTSKIVNAGTSSSVTGNVDGTLAEYYNISVNGYTDSDWAGSIDNRISTQGNIVLMNNNVISWNCQKQKSISQSSTEAEYVAINLVSRQVIWVQTLLNEIYGTHLCSNIYTDNQAAQHWTMSQKIKHQRVKHIDIAYKFAREQVELGSIVVKYVQTDKNLSDILTKGLSLETFTRLKNQIMCTN